MGALLELHNLELGYDKKRIFKGINATGSSGEFIALIGPNGTGKSTLLRTICHNSHLISGDIIINGKITSQIREKELAELITFVPSLIPRARNLSIYDMLSLNCYFRSNWLGKVGKKDRELIMDSLKLVGLEGFENRDSFSLSDGEYQRATIAGALVKDTPVIILDEPTAFLDASNKYLITNLLKEIANKNNKLIIFSTHDLQLAINNCDKIWLMGNDDFYDKAPTELISIGAFDKIFKLQDYRFDELTCSFRPSSF